MCLHALAVCDNLGRVPAAAFLVRVWVGLKVTTLGLALRISFTFLERQTYSYATDTSVLACLSCTGHRSVHSLSMCFIFTSLLLPVKNTNIMTNVLFSSSKTCLLHSLSHLRSRALGQEVSVVFGLLRL